MEFTKLPPRLGYYAKDIVSGQEGIIDSRTEFLTGCINFGIQPPSKDGVLPEGRIFDKNRIRVLNFGVRPDMFPEEHKKEIEEMDSIAVSKPKDDIEGGPHTLGRRVY